MRIGIDVGGTFTDVVGIDTGGRIELRKTFTTPGDLTEGVIDGVEKLLGTLGRGRGDVGLLVHGTTVGTNALIERKGARTGLLMTEGFRDVLEIGRVQRPDGGLYNFNVDNPPPIIPRRLRLEARERVGADGGVVAPLDEEGVRRAAAAFKREGVEAVAVSFLFSFLRPDHERRAREILQKELPGVAVSISSDVAPEFREYERTSTVAISAYLQPIVERYVERLGARLRERYPNVDLRLIQANGGATTPDAVRGRAVVLVNSGPAGGATACAYLGGLIGTPKLIGVDMGGTSFDVSMTEEARPIVTTEAKFMGLPIKVAMNDVDIIGAGGGSIAWVDRGGALNVGPQSAGAVPGPACYGRGGEEPTVTDANLVLGRIDPAYFLGGEIALDAGAARRAIERRVAKPLGMSVSDGAAAIVRVVDANMTKAIGVKSVHKGHDLREFALAAFGGAGPLHAAALADDLGIPEVVIPLLPGAFSAFGLLVADARHDYVRTLMKSERDVRSDAVLAALRELNAEGRSRLAKQGFGPEAIQTVWTADVRFEGQSYELNVPVGSDGNVSKLFADFSQLHERVYSFKAVDEKGVLVSLRVTALGRSPRVKLPQTARGDGDPKGRRQAWFAGAGFVETPVYERSRLGSGQTLAGPAIVEEACTVTVVPPGRRVHVDAYGHLRIRA